MNSRPHREGIDGELYAARVYLAEARRRRADTRFHAVLLSWAANARRRAIEARPQLELFGRGA